MANRPVFIPLISDENKTLVKIDYVDFEWKKGMAKINRQICIRNLHNAVHKKHSLNKILEISSSSENPLGVKLSAFNLTLNPSKINSKFPNKLYSVESIFQGSKVFSTNEGPFADIYTKNSFEAKKDIRIKRSDIKGFLFFDEVWPNNPYTLFYDYIYMNALFQNKELYKKILEFNAFTDIHFNPKKSMNCQAYSAAFFVGLMRNNLIEKILNKEIFINFARQINYEINEFGNTQNSLF